LSWTIHCNGSIERGKIQSKLLYLQIVKKSNHLQIEWIRIQKGKPQQNAIVERFNRTYREDVLDANLFFSLNHAREVTHSWIEEYNDDRPNEALNYKTTNEYVA
jgi:transposase InsO family protein